MRRAIESHLKDSSPAVRDAAVELIGKYIISMPKVAKDYYSQIADRIAVSVFNRIDFCRTPNPADYCQDTGLGVRKRVIKLFKSIYLCEVSVTRKIDMCHRLVLRMLDEDDTVKVVWMLRTKTEWGADAGS